MYSENRVTAGDRVMIPLINIVRNDNAVSLVGHWPSAVACERLTVPMKSASKGVAFRDSPRSGASGCFLSESANRRAVSASRARFPVRLVIELRLFNGASLRRTTAAPQKRAVSLQ